jgi:hypothetical protein
MATGARLLVGQSRSPLTTLNIEIASMARNRILIVSQIAVADRIHSDHVPADVSRVATSNA